MASYIPTLQLWQQICMSCVIFLVVANTIVNGQQQRVVPGINPNHYQQAPSQQAYQHPPTPPQYQQQQHHQQPPQQQQQFQAPPGHNPQQYQQYQQQQQQAPVPAQPQQQQAQQQQFQQPQQQQHHAPHGHHGQPQQVLNAGNINEERAHIQEHMQVPIDTSKMSEQELQFHYFKMHDSDNNNKLDGCELIKSLIHWHEQSSKEQHENNPNPDVQHNEKIFTDDEFVALIDPILNMDDTSRDGFIDYPEFIRAQQKAQQQQQQQQQPAAQQQNSN